MNNRRPSPLVLALLTPGASSRKDRAEEPAPPEPRKTVTIFVGAAVLGSGGPFRARGPAGAVALLEFGDVRKAFGDTIGDATTHEAAVLAAAVGVEQLKQRCRVRVVTDSTFLLHTMRGELRRMCQLGSFGRLDRALSSRNHLAEWREPETDEERGALAACHGSAAALASGDSDSGDALSTCVERSVVPLAAPEPKAPERDDEYDDQPQRARAAGGGIFSGIRRNLLRGVAALTRSGGRNRAEAE